MVMQNMHTATAVSIPTYASMTYIESTLGIILGSALWHIRYLLGVPWGHLTSGLHSDYPWEGVPGW